MEIDLGHEGDELGSLPVRLRSQVCIVGGGIAGLILAHRLMLGGITVTVLEAGGRVPPVSAARDPFAAELQGVTHRGTAEGRVRALGGCSLTWGGQLLPLPRETNWPVSAAELRRFDADWGMTEDVALFFAGKGLSLPGLLSHLPELKARLSRFLPFSRRNLAATLGKTLRASRLVQIVLHAPVRELVLVPAGERVSRAVVRTSAGGDLPVEADAFVMAAGTVETCRLLLASRSGRSFGIGNAHGQVGCNFHDHLTISAAVFTGAARARMLGELGPWVVSSGHRRRAVYSMKLEASAGLREQLGLHMAMAHLTVEEPEGTALEELRRLLRALQGGRSAGTLWGVLKRAPQMIAQGVRLAWYARVKHRRYVSPAATVRLQLNVAQDAPSASRVLLSEALDENGMPQAIVDWRISVAELASLRRLAFYLREHLSAAGICDGVGWEPALFTEGLSADENLRSRLDDARHAMGGACMGQESRSSVVDPDLRMHGVKNLFVASPAVFPDGSAQLPTMTLHSLCRRLAERLVAELGKRN